MNKYDRFIGRLAGYRRKRIQAHGGSVIFIDGVYYWYGENKEKQYLEAESGTGV